MTWCDKFGIHYSSTNILISLFSIFNSCIILYKYNVEKALSPMGHPEGGWMGVLKNLNKNLYVIPNFYPKRYRGISILLIASKSNKISNDKQWGIRDFYVDNPHTNCGDQVTQIYLVVLL